MEDKEKYNYSDFTRSNYRKLLKIAQKSYAFRFFDNYNLEKRTVIWRHDVDISPHAALKLAKIEKEENVAATYFFHFHNLFYNLLEAEIRDIVCEIISLGHSVGLHYEPDFYQVENDKDFNKYLEIEVALLEKITCCKIAVFSFHNPSESMILEYSDYKYSGLINTYSSFFRENFGYCSDSIGYWRFRRLEDVLREADDKNLQVLTHPAWWQEEEMSPRQRIQRCIEGRASKQQNNYDEIVKEMGRLNVR